MHSAPLLKESAFRFNEVKKGRKGKTSEQSRFLYPYFAISRLKIKLHFYNRFTIGLLGLAAQIPLAQADTGIRMMQSIRLQERHAERDDETKENIGSSE